MTSYNDKASASHSLSHITTGNEPIKIVGNVIPSYSETKVYNLPGLLDKETYEELEAGGKWTSGTGSYVNDIYFNTGKVGIGEDQPVESLHVDGAIIIGNTNNNVVGTLKWDGFNFRGYRSSGWISLDVTTTTNYYLSSVSFVGDDLEFTMGGGGSNFSFEDFFGTTADSVARGNHHTNYTSHSDYKPLSALNDAILDTDIPSGTPSGYMRRKTDGSYEIVNETYFEDNLVRDSHFTSQGFMRRTGTESYGILNETYLTNEDDTTIRKAFFTENSPTVGFMKRTSTGAVKAYDIDDEEYVPTGGETFLASHHNALLAITPHLVLAGSGDSTTHAARSSHTHSYEGFQTSTYLSNNYTQTHVHIELEDIGSNTGDDTTAARSDHHHGDDYVGTNNNPHSPGETFLASHHTTLLNTTPHLVLEDINIPAGTGNTEVAARWNHGHNYEGYQTSAYLAANYVQTHVHIELAGTGDDTTAAKSDHDHDITASGGAAHQYLAALPTGNDALIVESTHTHIGLAGTGSSDTHAAISDHNHGTAYITPAYMEANYMSVTKHNNEDFTASNHCVGDTYNDTKIENLFTAGVIKGKVTSGVVTSIQNQYQIDRTQINWVSPWPNEPLLKTAEFKEFADYPYGHNNVDGFENSDHCVGEFYTDTSIINVVKTTEMETIINNYSSQTPPTFVNAGTVNDKNVGVLVPANAVFTDRAPISFGINGESLVLVMAERNAAGNFVATPPYPSQSLASLTDDGVVGSNSGTGLDDIVYTSRTGNNAFGVLKIKRKKTVEGVDIALTPITCALNAMPPTDPNGTGWLHKSGGWSDLTWGRIQNKPPESPDSTSYGYHTHDALSSTWGIESKSGSSLDWKPIDIYQGGSSGATYRDLLRDYYASDIRKKVNIVDVEENYLAIIDDIKVFRYDWNSWMINNTMVKNINGRSNLGVSAQDLEEKIPEIVRETISDVKGINKSGMFAFMIKLIQELNSKSDDLDINLEIIADQLGLAI